MKRVLFSGLVFVMGFGAIGCGGDGMAITRSERAERHRRIREIDRKQLNDDIDLILLQDRPGRLSEWQVE